jgi:hypothetical protein
MANSMLIRKASGISEPFSEEKLRRSLQKVKTPAALTEKVISGVTAKLYEGITTREIYAQAFSFLKKYQRPTAVRYNLKKAIFDLGPTGYPFEKFVSSLLAAQGYSVEVGKMFQGACVTHEVDVAAEKDKSRLMVECKFHNQFGSICNIKTALYVQARFEDLADHFSEGWLVTNTKLSPDAIQYARCKGLKTIGWSYPPEKNFQYLIEPLYLYPVTCLTTLTTLQKRQLIEQGIILCKEIQARFELLFPLNLGDTRIKRVQEEINELMGA